jgi:flagellar motor protein MotB
MDNLIATGFLRMGPDSTSEREVNFVEDRLDVIGDEMDIWALEFSGSRIKCAKCHSHKYDPIPQRDYYRMLAVFKGAYDEHDWLMPQHAGNGAKAMAARFLPYVTPGATPAQLMEEQQERETTNGKLDREIEALKAELEQKAEPIKKKLVNQKLEQFPPSLREDLRTMLGTPPESRDEVQKYLAKRFEEELKIQPQELKNSDHGYRQEAERTERQIKLIEYKKLPEPKIQALWDRGVPSPTRILRRGEPDNFGRCVGPAVPEALTDGKAVFKVSPPWPGATKTGRRLAFARWLVRPDNPLTSRVMVNRIWNHHFGAGIVKTLGNFGNAGARPSHPELLDWLATEFVRQGWSIKSMHRLMMTSSTYRQSSAMTPLLEKQDPENILLSRMPMKRMEAEVLNDTLLLISKRLDETRYGPPQPVEVRDDGLVTPIETSKGWRRSIYVTQRRTQLPTLLENFDMPAMSPNCLERNVSIVAPQALNLLNNAMIQKLAQSLAERVRKEEGDDPQSQVERLYWIAYGRSATEEEKRLCLEALNRVAEPESRSSSFRAMGDRKIAASLATSSSKKTELVLDQKKNEPRDLVSLTNLCHTIMNSAAFLYID